MSRRLWLLSFHCLWVLETLLTLKRPVCFFTDHILGSMGTVFWLCKWFTGRSPPVPRHLKFPSLSPLQCLHILQTHVDIQKYVSLIDRHTSKAQTAAHCRDASIPDFFQKVTSSSSVDRSRSQPIKSSPRVPGAAQCSGGCLHHFLFPSFSTMLQGFPFCTLAKDGFFIFTGLGRNA